MSNTAEIRKKKVGAGFLGHKMAERTFSRGTMLFMENDTSSEMYIIRTGKVRILKQEGDKSIELAVLGPGSVLGELSLLDHQPRSATAQVIDDTVAIVIDENLFDHTLKSIPEWLSNIILIVVGRLRDTMRKTSDRIIAKSVAGVIRILMILDEINTRKNGSQQPIPIQSAKEWIGSVIGIGELETERIFLLLILKELLLIRKDESGREYLHLLQRDVLQLYMQFLRAKQRGGVFLGENLSDQAALLINAILAAGQKGAKIVKEGIKRIGLSQVELELQRRDQNLHIDRDALDELIGAKIIFKEDQKVRTEHQTHSQIFLFYNEAALLRMQTLHLWIPIFKEEITF